MTEEKTFKEEIKVTGQQLVETVKKLVHEGNVRRLIIKNEKGETFMEIPVTVATIGALILPIVAAVGAVAALAANYTIEVIKTK